MHKKVQLIITFLLISGVFFTATLVAQDLPAKDRKVIAVQAIKELKDGTMILRLKSKNNKITKLNELLAAPTLNDVNRLKITEELEETIAERDNYNQTLIDAFDKYYSFSKLYLMYDTASISLKNGVRSGIFLDKSLNPDPTIEIPEGPFYLVRTGTTDSSSTTGVAAIVIMDRHLKDMLRPFPYYVRTNDLGRIFTRIFNHNKLVKRDASKVVQKLEKNLRKFFTEINSQQ